MARRGKSENEPMSFFSFQDIISCTTGIVVLITLLLTMELLTRKLDAPDSVSMVLDEAVAHAGNQRNTLKEKVKEGRKMLLALAGGQIITQTQVAAAQAESDKLTGDNKELADKIVKLAGDYDLAGIKAGAIEKKIGKIIEKVENLEKQIIRGKHIPDEKKLVGKGIPGMKPIWVECSASEFLVTRISEQGADKGLAKVLKRCTGREPLKEFLKWAGETCDSQKEYFVLLFRPDACDKWLEARVGLARLKFKVNWNVWPRENSLHPKTTKREGPGDG